MARGGAGPPVRATVAPMRSFWRLLLLCLMALALPVQGFAAAGGAHCGAMHERMQASAAQDHHHPADAMDAAEAPHHDDAAQVGLGDASKCSACATCCVALGLPATSLLLPVLRAESAQPCFAAAGPAAFLTSGPERPPRAILA